MKNKSNAAKKAWATRRANAKQAATKMTNQARRDYRNQYGETGYKVMQFISKGLDSQAVAILDEASKKGNVNGQLAAHKANLSRDGAQRELAITCDFGL
tara:strand:- start:5879 stop:6175 length:297 start_codon:yes stop_codon:yes gene_type:complete